MDTIQGDKAPIEQEAAIRLEAERLYPQPNSRDYGLAEIQVYEKRCAVREAQRQLYIKLSLEHSNTIREKDEEIAGMQKSIDDAAWLIDNQKCQILTLQSELERVNQLVEDLKSQKRKILQTAQPAKSYSIEQIEQAFIEGTSVVMNVSERPSWIKSGYFKPHLESFLTNLKASKEEK